MPARFSRGSCASGDCTSSIRKCNTWDSFCSILSGFFRRFLILSCPLRVGRRHHERDHICALRASGKSLGGFLRDPPPTRHEGPEAWTASARFRGQYKKGSKFRKLRNLEAGGEYQMLQLDEFADGDQWQILTCANGIVAGCYHPCIPWVWI